jgi:hypothetical protein
MKNNNRKIEHQTLVRPRQRMVIDVVMVEGKTVKIVATPNAGRRKRSTDYEKRIMEDPLIFNA